MIKSCSDIFRSLLDHHCATNGCRQFRKTHAFRRICRMIIKKLHESKASNLTTTRLAPSIYPHIIGKQHSHPNQNKQFSLHTFVVWKPFRKMIFSFYFFFVENIFFFIILCIVYAKDLYECVLFNTACKLLICTLWLVLAWLFFSCRWNEK